MSNQIALETIPPGFTPRYSLEEQKGIIHDIEWSPDGRMLAIVDSNNTVRICDAENGSTIWKQRENSSMTSISWSPDGKTLAVGCGNTNIKLLNTKTGKFRRRILKGHSDWVWKVKWSPDGCFLASNSRDSSIRIWDTKTWSCHTLKVYQNNLPCSMVWSLDGQSLLSASYGYICRWDSKTGQLIGFLNGESGEIGLVTSMELSPNKQYLAIVSDNVVQIWDIKTGQPINILEGHTHSLTSISFSYDGRLLASKSNNGSIRIWRCDIWETLAVFPNQTDTIQTRGVVFNPKQPTIAILSESGIKLRVWNLDINILLNTALGFETVRYRSAKIVLVGDTGVGKSGLGNVLAGQEFKPTASTHGRHVWSLGVTSNKSQNDLEENREMLLWDLAGQVEYRLINQLSLDETSVALVLFDGSSPTDPFKGVAFWNKALRQAKGSDHLVKYLVAARTDVSTLTVTDERMNAFASELGFEAAFRTSALTGEGVKELLEEIQNAIDWERLPLTVSERLFKQMKDFIVNQKQNGHVLKIAADIMQQFRIMYPEASFNEDDFRAAIVSVESHDLVKNLSFGDYVLLQSELLDNYASAMARAAREQPDGLGCLEEQEAREGSFNFGSLERISEDEESIILQSVVELFISKELAIIDAGKLIFPSQFNRELPEYPNVQGSTVTYQFDGALMNIYTTLVVRLYYSEVFRMEPLWKNTAIFLPLSRKDESYRCGFTLEELDEGTGRITIFFGQQVADDIKNLFLKYVHEHLNRKAIKGSLKRERIYRCCECNKDIKDREAVNFRIEQGISTIPCQYCSTNITLIDLIEETFGKKDEFLAKVRELDEKIGENLDNASKETILKGEVMTLVGKAGQIFRPTSNDDWGIDGEIEFKNNKHQASGKRIYVQLKSGKSYLNMRKDGVCTFHISDERHLDYWLSQPCDVYLIVRDGDEKIYWMNITEYLRTWWDKKSSTIVFKKEEFTIEALQGVRRIQLAEAAKALKPASMQ
ncbi:MAG: DUF4365 domain-containing protein [Calothrix sp. MO_167.B12]|nr:DUF4365 domain-containing protein [Calothrix sp. MO_167.B12]